MELVETDGVGASFSLLRVTIIAFRSVSMLSGFNEVRWRVLDATTETAAPRKGEQ
jgi:hypothetical protein